MPGSACSFSTRMRAFSTRLSSRHDGRDAFGERLGEIDMAGGDDGADVVRDRLIVDDAVELVAFGTGLAGEPDIDPHRLRLAVLVTMHADPGEQFQIADEDKGDILGHCSTPTSAVFQIRC